MRHKYEYCIDIQGSSAAAWVSRFVGSGKRVLELGAGPGSITRVLTNVQHCSVTAVERDTTAIPKLTPFCERVVVADLERDDWAASFDGAERFDVVVAADVLEHLYDPPATLRRMAGLLCDSGEVVISLPHIGHNAVVACLVNSHFEYRNWGLLDQTHVRFFGIRDIQSLFSEANLSIVDVRFIVAAPERTEFSKQWQQLPHDLRKCLTARNRFGAVYQVVVKAVRKRPGMSPIDLCSLVPPPVPSRLAVLSEGIRTRLAGILRR